MGNTTDPKKWASRERLHHIERLAYWRGWVRRSDLVDEFGISVPQASADIAAYVKMNPGAIGYDATTKRYTALESMKLKLGRADLQDGFAILDNTANVARTTTIDLPERHISENVARCLINATSARNSVEINYFSVNAGTATWRWIAPQAFAHDGYRWHVRAWCERDGVFKDFVLGRMAATRRSRVAPEIPPDRDWSEWTVVKFKAHRRLTAIQRRAIEMDFGMRKGLGHLRVRKAMLLYTLNYLGLNTGNPAGHRMLERFV